MNHFFSSALYSEFPNTKPQVASTEVDWNSSWQQSGYCGDPFYFYFKHLSGATFPLPRAKAITGDANEAKSSTLGTASSDGIPLTLETLFIYF